MKHNVLSVDEIVPGLTKISQQPSSADLALERLLSSASGALRAPLIVLTLHSSDSEVVYGCAGIAAYQPGVRLAGAHMLGPLAGTGGTRLVVGDIATQPLRQAHPLIQASGLHAYIIVPLRNAAHTLTGYLLIGDTTPRTWQPEQLALLDAFTNHAADLLVLRAQHARQQELEQALEESNSRAQALLETITHRRDQLDVTMLPSENTTRALLNALPDIMFRINREGRFLDYQAPHESLLFARPEDFLGRLLDEIMPPTIISQTHAAIREALETGKTQFFEYQLTLPDGKVSDYEARVVPSDTNEVIAIVRDITERKRLEAQFLQIQKIESVGQLAGGIAHDFNNLLTAIIGYAELALMSLPPNDSAMGDVEEIHRAAERATGLTRQLLSFARWQMMEMRSIRLNDLIFDLYKLLRRLIGEDIELIILPSYHESWVKVDPGQIEQVLVNLAINARDAMPKGGKLTIAIGHRTLNDESARRMPGANPGDYVLLTISDTGVGMDAHVKTHLFEPFFTTKEKGRGTGLGLATCYGIVKQHGGLIDVASIVGVGTTIEIYLPQIVGEGGMSYSLLDDARGLPRGNETILLVEDEPAVRVLAARVLRAQGYIVLEAENGDEALSIARQRGRAVLHLLLTDMVMPRMSGKTLAERVTAMLPDAKILFTSGYTNDIMIYQGTAASGLAFLQKPFTPMTLARKVREVLDS